jgi:hypothetical protein
VIEGFTLCRGLYRIISPASALEISGVALSGDRKLQLAEGAMAKVIRKVLEIFHPWENVNDGSGFFVELEESDLKLRRRRLYQFHFRFPTNLFLIAELEEFGNRFQTASRKSGILSRRNFTFFHRYFCTPYSRQLVPEFSILAVTAVLLKSPCDIE